MRPDGYDALPRRFREYVAKMERELQTFREMNSAVAGSRIVLRAYDGSEQFISESLSVRIYTGKAEPGAWNSRWVEVKLDRRWGDDGVEVSGGEPLLIYPEVSNVFVVKPRGQ